MTEKISIELVTLTRDDIVNLSHSLAQAVRAVFPKHTQDLQLTLRGAYNSGKSIIPELIREDIWGAATDNEVTGNKNYDEYWVRDIDGQKCEFDYIDMAATFDYSRPELCERYDAREKQALKLRQHPGITALQNKRDDEDADIAVWVEKQGEDVVRITAMGDAIVSDEGKIARYSPLSQAFNKAAHVSLWARYIRVSFNAELVKATPELQSLITDLSAKSAEVKNDLETLGQDEEKKQRLLQPKYLYPVMRKM